MRKKSEGTKVWEIRSFPKVVGKKAFVLPGVFYGQGVLLMAEAGYDKASSVDEADVVVFMGGADISPALYGQKNVSSYYSDDRDAIEKVMYEEAVKRGKVCFGICRGAQFLHAMNGGVLWQDVDNHAGRDHTIVDLDEDVRLTVTSMHHQMLQDNDTLEVIAVTENQLATSFVDENLHIQLSKKSGNSNSNSDFEIEIEAGAYHGTKCFFVQGHPEVGSLYYKTWTMTKLNDLIHEWTSTESTKEIVKGMNVCAV